MKTRRTVSTATPKRRNPNVSRRAFLGSIGAGAALSPFIPLLESKADGALAPKRLILLFSPNGTLHERWAPTGTENDFQLGEILQPLEAYKDQMIILDGIQLVRPGIGNHHQRGMGGLWTGNTLNTGDGGTAGWAGGRSIDQAVANAIGGDTAYKSLEFGVHNFGNETRSRMIYASNNNPIAAENNPQAMFDRLFADLNVDTSELDRIKAERRSVLDLIHTRFASFENRYSASDKAKVSAHLDAIREIEKRNDSVVAPACEAPVQNADLEFNLNVNFPTVSRLMIAARGLFMKCSTSMPLSWLIEIVRGCVIGSIPKM